MMIKEREYVLNGQAESKIRQQIISEKQLDSDASFSNARFVRNMIEKAMRNHAVRLLNSHIQHPSKQELMTLRAEDIKLDRKTSKETIK
jgi:stage V sporulation protein K